MSIQLRTSTNKVQQLSPDVRFVELVDGAGALACAVYEDEAGIIHIIRKGDAMFTRYVNMFRLTPSGNALELSQ